MLKDLDVSRLKDFASIFVLTYPVFTGLYLAGFLSETSFDLVTAFEFTDFLFKSSIIFLSISALILGGMLFMGLYQSVLVAPVTGGISKLGKQAEADETSNDKAKWKTTTPRRRFIGIALQTPALMIAVAFWISEVFFSQTVSIVNITCVTLASMIFFGNLWRFFVSEEVWRVAVKIYWAFSFLMIPIWLGFNDYRISDSSPKFILKAGSSCLIRFIGTESVWAVCDNTDTILQKDDGKIVFSRP